MTRLEKERGRKASASRGDRNWHGRARDKGMVVVGGRGWRRRSGVGIRGGAEVMRRRGG